MELCNVGTEQLTGLPLCQEQDLSGHACRDIGIAIPITADPARYFDRRPIRAGQRQRVGIANLVLSEAPILILDGHVQSTLLYSGRY